MYQVGFGITWAIAFLVCWVYAIATYGFFLGVGLGWFPAAIVAALVALAWPLILLAAIFLGAFLLKG
jgi:hypothetical protein